jgi:hypothetical protein
MNGLSIGATAVVVPVEEVVVGSAATIAASAASPRTVSAVKLAVAMPDVLVVTTIQLSLLEKVPV